MQDTRFDLIFSGTMEEQEFKATRFRTGVSEQVRAGCSEFASSILYDRERARLALKQVKEYEDAFAAMVADPRAVVLKKWIDERDADKAAHLIVEAMMGRRQGDQGN